MDANPEHAPAYIGKLCAELKLRREESLGDYQELRQGKKFDKPLGEYGHFQKAIRFAEDGYRKKLNGYEQKIKDSFQKKIPKKFTDEFIKGEIARLENEIADCTEKITNLKWAISHFQSEADKARNRQNELVETEKNIDTDVGGHTSYAEIRNYLEEYDKYYQKLEEDAEELLNKRDETQKEADDYTRKKAEYEAEKREIESWEGISCLDRMDSYYDHLVEAMQKASTKDEYKNLAEQFRSLEGYKNSAELSGKCGKLAVKTKYERLVKEKNAASSEDTYKQLAKEFREMGAYENSAQLADECDKLAIKTKYERLIKEKNAASSEDTYKQLAKEFREMNGYEKSNQLADECDKQIRVLKERLEEQKRQEEEKRRKEAIEQERLEAQEKERLVFEEKTKNMKKKHRIIGGVLSLLFAAISTTIIIILCGAGADYDTIVIATILNLLFLILIHFTVILYPIMFILMIIPIIGGIVGGIFMLLKFRIGLIIFQIIFLCIGIGINIFFIFEIGITISSVLYGICTLLSYILAIIFPIINRDTVNSIFKKFVDKC